MKLTAQRDLDALRAGLERWLGRSVGSINRPAPGYSCETLIVDDELVVRLPPLGEGIFPTYDLAQQAAAQEAVAAVGVPVASPVRFEPDAGFLGAPFLTMPFVRGPIPSDFTPLDKWLGGLDDDSARARVWRSTLDAIATIHTAPLDGIGLRTGLDAELQFWADYVAWMADAPPPALVDALAWCRAHKPTAEPAAALVWGDVRFGNVVYDSTALVPKAVLDWDMVSAAPPEMDVAWLLALDAVGAEMTGMTVRGFGTRDDAIALFESHLSRRLVDLDWYEIFALVRASAISTRIAVLFERAGEKTMFKIGDDPTLAAALRRIAALDA